MSVQDDIQKLRQRVSALQSELDAVRGDLSRLERSVPPEIPETAAASAAPPHAEPGRSFSITELNLGGNILGKLGLFTIIIAAVWFVKFAIDNRWINESGRIYLALGAGFAGVAWGTYLAKKRLRIIPAALTGTGASLLYIAIFGAYYFYSLLGRNETFIFLAILSVALALLSARAGIQSLYIFSVLGAFMAPLLVSSGENSYRFLFSYIALINALFFVLSRYRVWNLSAYLLLVADTVLFSAWAADKLIISSFSFPFLFLLFVFILFMSRQTILLPLLNHAAGRADSGLVMLAAAAFMLPGAWVVDSFHPSLRPHFLLGVSALIVVFYILHIRFGGLHERA